jgi:hypothetical protein
VNFLERPNRYARIIIFHLGEQLQGNIARALIRHLSNQCVIVNLYAPAECTIAAFYYRIVSADMDIPAFVPIGRCLPGRTAAILDFYGQQIIPDGRSTGEIFIGGIGIFAGYLNRPEDTARVLVDLPHRHGVFYRTGDIGRMTCQGELVFVGRTDFQVKLRGQRIELGEIETVIMRCSTHITNSVVVKLMHNDIEHLVAYVQTSAPLEAGVMRDTCMQYLPLYMVPSLFVLLDRFPLNPNGKLDRRALPTPDFSLLLSSHSVAGDQQPYTEREQQVSSIWCGILHMATMPSADTNFFQLGGNSLLLIALHHAYQSQFQQSVNISDLFRHATIARHAQLLDTHRITIESSWLPCRLTKGTSLQHMRILQSSCFVLPL